MFFKGDNYFYLMKSADYSIMEDFQSIVVVDRCSRKYCSLHSNTEVKNGTTTRHYPKKGRIQLTLLCQEYHHGTLGKRA